MDTPDSTTKTCSKCGLPQPRTREFFSPRPANSDGLEGRCKACEAKRRAVERVEYPERHKASQKRYRDSRRDWWIERARQWREAHREHIALYRRTYYDANPEARRATSRRCYHANPSHYASANRMWRLNNRERDKERQHRRRARLAGAGGSYTKDDVKLQLKAQGNNCWWCGKPFKQKYQVDHRIPISRGGSNDASNIVLAHAFCNQSKKDKTPAEFMGRLF